MEDEDSVAFEEDDDSALDSEEPMLELEMFVSLEEFTSWLLEEELRFSCPSDEEPGSLEDELRFTSSEEDNSVSGSEGLSSPQAINNVAVMARAKSFFKVFSFLGLFT